MYHCLYLLTIAMNNFFWRGRVLMDMFSKSRTSSGEFLFGTGRMPMKHFRVRCTQGTRVLRYNKKRFFRKFSLYMESLQSPIHLSSNVAINKNIVLDRDRVPIENFPSSIHHSRTAAKNKKMYSYGGIDSRLIF